MNGERFGDMHWISEIDQLRERGLLRSMPQMQGFPGRIVRVNDKEALNFSSNNYLGLAAHPGVVQAMVESAMKYGAGSTASRLIAGNGEAYRELESAVASWRRTEAALIFGSGYQANVGLLSSLAGDGDLIISDQLNHASIIDGCRLSRARVAVYPHLDTGRVEELLKSPGFRRKVLVTESIFSMDGDAAPLKDLDALCTRWGALLMLDEAHATGVVGPAGRGLAAKMGVVPDIQMGTLGKAVGTYGAYVAGSKPLIDFLVNRARSFIYTTGLPPAVVGAATAALRILISEEGDRRRSRLMENVKLYSELLPEQTGPGGKLCHIVPVRIGESSKTMKISAHCLERGVFAHGIRFPTVPEGTARLRFTLMSDHTSEDLRKAADVLQEALRGTL